MSRVPVGALSLLAACVCLAGSAGCEPSGAAYPATVTIKPIDAGPAAGAEQGADGGAAVEAAGFGAVEGRVVFEGNAPNFDPLVAQGAPIRDAAVCSAEPVPDESLVLGPNGGVQNVFIYLPRAPAGALQTPPSTERVIFDQKGCRFEPHALLARAEQPIMVLSDDPIAHNTHTFPRRNSSFNQVIEGGDRDGVPLVYSKAEAEPVEVKCDFHAWMLAYHLPLDHPFGAVSGEDGTFRIDNLPAGTHRFRVWHEAAEGGYLSRGLEVTIAPDEVATVDIPYPADRFIAWSRPATKSVQLSALLDK